jgi:DNA-binding MarR family transcriptional regulator
MSTAEGESLTNLVREHSSAVIRYAAATAKRMGLEASELSALEHLQAAGPMTLGQLGERLSMSPGAVTALVDRLEKKAYVERLPNPKDRRSALVRETDTGLIDSLKHLWPYIEEMKGIEGSFSEEEREIIARFLSAATEATHRHAGTPGSRERAE